MVIFYHYSYYYYYYYYYYSKILFITLLYINDRHYPVGVLFDLYADPHKLPWKITVHFQGFPSGKILRCPNTLTVKNQYMNVLKEANYLTHGDTTKVNNLSIDQHTDLWHSVELSIFYEYI